MAANDNIQDALDKVRRVHEPYARKKPTLYEDKLSVIQQIRLGLQSESKRQTEEMRENIANNSVDKIIPQKASTKYGSFDNIAGKDLIKITPRAKDFKNAILETSQPLNHEVLYYFDKNGKVVARFKGEELSVTTTGNYEYAATLHNHPRVYGVTTSTFSPTDIDTYTSNFNKIDHYVVTESHVFKFNIGNMQKKDRRALVREYNTKTNDLIDKLFDKPTSKNQSCFVYFDSREKLNKARHNLLVELAKKYGFEYSVTTLEDFKKANKI